tara:strand:- start:975 stop:1421 length:447 start_codon:yes stop_codon:yes gene_type:complete
MNQFFSNIAAFLLTILVVFLSVGVSISKMQCSTDGIIFIGTQVPNCMQIGSDDLKEFSCCIQEEDIQSCCPQTKDDSCASETANFQFNFETLISSLILDFNETSALLYTCLLNEKYYVLKNQFVYLSDGPLPPNLLKPKLAEIQSFLL